jgi:hypothetical protein
MVPEQNGTAAPSTHWPGAGIFVKVEFGVNFSPRNMRNVTFGYASRNMEQQMFGGRQSYSGLPRSDPEDAPSSNHPQILQPGYVGGEDEQERPRRRRIRSRSALQLRTNNLSMSPVSEISPENFDGFSPQSGHAHHPSHSSGMSTNTFVPQQVSAHQPYQSYTYPSPSQPYDLSSPNDAFQSYQDYTSQSTGPSRRTPAAFYPIRQSTIDRKPLPPLPSRFRLGEDDLPWSSPTILPNTDSPWTPFAEPASLHHTQNSITSDHSTEQFRSSSPVSYFDQEQAQMSPMTPPTQHRFASSDNERANPTNERVNEDPFRTRELASLQSAMLTIDSIDSPGWSPGDSGFNWDGGLPSGPRGIGWAVRVEDPREERERERLRRHANRFREVQSQRDRERGRRLRETGNAENLAYPPPPYISENAPGHSGVGQWGWEWEWEDRYGYWVRADLRRSHSR